MAVSRMGYCGEVGDYDDAAWLAISVAPSVADICWPLSFIKALYELSTLSLEATSYHSIAAGIPVGVGTYTMRKAGAARFSRLELTPLSRLAYRCCAWFRNFQTHHLFAIMIAEKILSLLRYKIVNGEGLAVIRRSRMGEGRSPQ